MTRCRHRQDYVDLLKLVYDLLVKSRKEGLLAIEADIEDPAKSAVTTFAYAVANKVWLQHLRAAGRADAAVELRDAGVGGDDDPAISCPGVGRARSGGHGGGACGDEQRDRAVVFHRTTDLQGGH